MSIIMMRCCNVFLYGMFLMFYANIAVMLLIVSSTSEGSALQCFHYNICCIVNSIQSFIIISVQIVPGVFLCVNVHVINSYSVHVFVCTGAQEKNETSINRQQY